MSSSVLMATPTSPPTPHYTPISRSQKSGKPALLSFLYELLVSLVYLPSRARTAPAPAKSHSFSTPTKTPPATPPPSPFSSSTGFSRGSPRGSGATTGSVRALTRTPAPSQPLVRMRKKTLVLDLDETLIHSTSLSSGREPYDFRAEVRVNEHVILYYVYKRPHVDLFLSKVGEWYNVVIFTASVREYADPVIDFLDRSRRLIKKRLFRNACVSYHGSYIKDLRTVDKDLSQVLLIDNCPTAYLLQQENGMPIEGWMNDRRDCALLELLPFLDALRFTSDVRNILSMRLIR